jgi:hypothetical protein
MIMPRDVHSSFGSASTVFNMACSMALRNVLGRGAIVGLGMATTAEALALEPLALGSKS